MRLDSKKHHKTKNRKGFMHPITEIGKKFISFSQQNSPTADIGCAYGNTVIAAIDAGAEKVIACDMEKEHLDILNTQLDELEKKHLVLKQGALPRGLNFGPDSLSGIHASLVLPYLSELELDECLNNFYGWLKPDGKLFILCYSIFIKELANPFFKSEYKKRLESGKKWPGYLEDFSQYSYTDGIRNQHDASSFPVSLHFFDLDILIRELKVLNFEIEFSEYLNGPENGAVKDTWHDGKEFVGVVARK